MNWEGASAARDIMLIALAAPGGRQGAFVTLHGADGYTTNLPTVALLDDDVLVTHSFEDAPLSDDHEIVMMVREEGRREGRRRTGRRAVRCD